ncbi:hypothetical protein [Gorillibacterium sp. CAU 1737]|uniref:hypothetical protein n=1 Tax=Gorillibacterium sp. CAU 1737 TaxID=3140362 RepID=UPI00325FE082
MLTHYQPVWPETAVFWGAGATAQIGMSTTAELAKVISLLANKEETDLSKRVYEATKKYGKKWGNPIFDLLCILGDPGATDEDITNASNRQFSDSQAIRIVELQKTYDWKTLYYIINICPGGSTGNFQLQDLFNIIDMHLQNRQGFYIDKNLFISVENLIPAKNALKMLITLIHTLDYQIAIEKNSETLEHYKKFAQKICELMIEEGRTFYKEFPEKTERGFYLFSHSFISMNWDPILLWILFNVHKETNEKNELIDSNEVPIKMFHDMGHFMGVRHISGDSPSVWYPFNETVVQRVNDKEHRKTRIVRVGKFYFPHGCSGWRECPNCGKLTMYLGSKWGIDEKSLFPPHILELFNFGFEKKSIEEAEAFNNGIYDALQCAFCGTITEIKHTPLVMQSNFKGEHPSFVEEIQRDMRVSLEGARHIILMGYSLPPDDVIYRSLLAARKNREIQDGRLYCTVIGFHKDAENKWYTKDCDLENFIEKIGDHSFVRAIKSAIDIFGIENVRAYGAGIPSVFINRDTNEVDISTIKDLMYPGNIFENNAVVRKNGQ